MPGARAVLWDIGNVLADWNPRRLYTKLLTSDAAVDDFLGGVCTMAWHQAHDRGVPMAENRLALIEAHPEKAELIEAWETRWPEMFDGWITGMKALVGELETACIAQYALTNYPAEKIPHLYDTFPSIARFRDVIVSGDEGVVKPDPAIYAIARARIGLDPAQVVFLDDRQENVAAARAAGFQAELFTGESAARAALRTRGLPV
ncbi:HAD-IA family hydrolase [Hyphomonadaceae bacterium ML37]|nr:HAD-IA family hydrolase [Hyphomonadaceae bacterium ML37]